jgi:hypothetical protein
LQHHQEEPRGPDLSERRPVLGREEEGVDETDQGRRGQDSPEHGGWERPGGRSGHAWIIPASSSAHTSRLPAFARHEQCRRGEAFVDRGEPFVVRGGIE